jgi:hypothetical protein
MTNVHEKETLRGGMLLAISVLAIYLSLLFTSVELLLVVCVRILLSCSFLCLDN